MSFRVFGFPVLIQPFFMVVAVLFGIMNHQSLAGLGLPKIVIWIVLMTFGIMFHELGHAVAMRRYRLEPEIVLHGFGGYTTARGLGGLNRPQHVLVSAAGPMAGALLGLITYGIHSALADSLLTMSPKVRELVLSTIYDSYFVNFGWTILNLIPVVPLDGGHIVQHTLGPKRIRITLYISIIVALMIVAVGLQYNQLFLLILFGSYGFMAYRQLSEVREEAPNRSTPPRKKAVVDEETASPELIAQLQKARVALAADRWDEAGTIAELILTEEPPPSMRVQALTIIGWAHLLEGRPDEAARVVKVIAKLETPDPGLAGGVLLEQGQPQRAREIFEAARKEGNDSKEIVGPLIQILIQEGQVARAAAIALDIVDTLNDDDVRQMATIAAEAGAHSWASRLYEALFERTSAPDDAYEAARQRGLEGDVEGARVLLERAVSAGFSDAARAWSDKALASLREGDVLEGLLPREST